MGAFRYARRWLVVTGASIIVLGGGATAFAASSAHPLGPQEHPWQQMPLLGRRCDLRTGMPADFLPAYCGLGLFTDAGCTHPGGCLDCSRHPLTRSAAGLRQLAGVGRIGLGDGCRGRTVVDVRRPRLDLAGRGDVDEAGAAIDLGGLQRVERAAGVPASVRGGARDLVGQAGQLPWVEGAGLGVPQGYMSARSGLPERPCP